MTWLSAKSSIANAVQICAAKGIRHAVISPGSRNAALTISLDGHPDITCVNIPDERVAAFFALGLAQQTGVPVILCCTSGSAALNYAPAIVEAYYQKIPLIVMTADRPVEWVDQRAGQTMRQRDVYANYIKASFEIMGEADQEDHLWYNDRIINQAVDIATLDGHGPVHINFPMREPLYDRVELSEIPAPKIVKSIQRKNVLPDESIIELQADWDRHKSVLVIIGQRGRSERFDRAIEALSALPQVVILTETTSNVCANQVYRSIDRLIDSMKKEEYDLFRPDLVISCAGALVSKKIRYMIRDMHPQSHWHIDPNDNYIDTYKSLTRNVPLMIEELVPIIAMQPATSADHNFKLKWAEREQVTKQAHDEYLKTTPWCDLKINNMIHEKAPPGQLHVASSTPVRYLQLFETRMDLQYRCNRGVSGIDGCTSTAIGAAFAADDLVTLITGDVAFFYDSNALWHHHVPSNIRIFLINNEGGNIFRYVKGPQTTDQFEQHFESYHTTSARGIAEAYGVAYIMATDQASLIAAMSEVYDEDYDKATIIEISTPRESNIEILKDYFGYIAEQVHQNQHARS